jgi:hypothetical protein
MIFDSVGCIAPAGSPRIVVFRILHVFLLIAAPARSVWPIVGLIETDEKRAYTPRQARPSTRNR